MENFTGKKVAVLGLGIVGSRCLARLRSAGWQATGWNRTPKGIEGEAASLEESVRGAAIVSLYLKDAPAIRAVVAKILPLLERNTAVLNHATIDLETTRWLADECAKHGVRFLDCPFTGSKMAAANGQLVYYTAGDDTLAAALEEYLAVTSRKRLPCGTVGNATTIKLATNLISASIVQAMAEAIGIATSQGVPVETLAAAVAENASSSALSTMKFPAIIAGDYDTHFSLANMAKDARYMLALAAASDLETPSIAAVSARMETLCATGLGEHDYSVLAKPYMDGGS